MTTITSGQSRAIMFHRNNDVLVTQIRSRRSSSQPQIIFILGSLFDKSGSIKTMINFNLVHKRKGLFMSKYETGFYKGENILTESDPGKRWCDHMNNISVEVEFDKDWNPLDKFSVVERLRGNKSHKWASGMRFEDATDLAERLVVGKDYLPPIRKVTIHSIPYLEYEVGDIVPGNFHMHTLNPRGPGFDYTYVDDSRMEIDRDFWLAAHKSELSSNKSGVIVSMSEEDIPEKIMVVYSYDDSYFSAMLRRNEESLLDFYGRMGVK